jgi:hypothetical protein
LANWTTTISAPGSGRLASCAVLGDAAETALRKALASDSLEVRLRARQLLDALDPASKERERLRMVRAVAVLEQADTPAAWKALRELAKAAQPQLAEEARRALGRRRAGPPW